MVFSLGAGPLTSGRPYSRKELAINAETGELASITDLKGNTTLFTGDSIDSSADHSNQFTRDWDGRITSVIDSQPGKTVN